VTTASILPDGSIVLQRQQQVVHVDAEDRRINIRAPSSIREVGGVTIASFSCDLTERVRIVRAAEGEYKIFLDLEPDRIIDLGTSPTHTVAMRIAWAVSDVTRAEVFVETVEADIADASADDEPTTPIPLIEEMPQDEAVTELPGSVGAEALAAMGRIVRGEPTTESDRDLEDPEPTTLDPWAEMEPPTPADTLIDIGRKFDDAAAAIPADDPYVRTPPPEIASAAPYTEDDDDPLDDTMCRPITDEERMAALPDGDEPLTMRASGATNRHRGWCFAV